MLLPVGGDKRIELRLRSMATLRSGIRRFPWSARIIITIRVSRVHLITAFKKIREPLQFVFCIDENVVMAFGKPLDCILVGYIFSAI